MALIRHPCLSSLYKQVLVPLLAVSLSVTTAHIANFLKEEQQVSMSNPEQQVQTGMSEEEPNDGVPIVLVTGASGFIAIHLIKQLLEQGRYHVRGTVRSLKKEEKVIFMVDSVSMRRLIVIPSRS